MKYPQFTIDEILVVFRRRKKIFFYPLIVISLICITGAFVLPKKYESSTTILVQRDEVLNPLLSYTMAVATASDNRLKDFNEIIYSRPALESLIDSLGLGYTIRTDDEKNKVVKQIKKNIITELQGSDSYTIRYLDPAPWRAQKAVQVLSEYFIKTKLEVDNKRNELAVGFFENKLDDLRNKFEQSQQKFLSVVKQQVNQLPVGDRALYSNIDDYNSKIGTMTQKLQDDQNALSLIKQYESNINDPNSVQLLFQVPLLDVPYSGNLSSLLNKYDNLTQKYTPEYPDVQDAKTQISNLVAKIKKAVQNESQNIRNEIWQDEKQRNSAISTIKQATISQNQNGDVRSTYDIYQKLYDDMKIKLEQAKTTRDLGEKGAEQFMVLDPPQLPTSPAKPNKILLILGGIGLGLFIGFLSAGLTELFDTRIRTDKDMEMYDKPILAYLPAHFSSPE